MDPDDVIMLFSPEGNATTAVQVDAAVHRILNEMYEDAETTNANVSYMQAKRYLRAVFDGPPFVDGYDRYTEQRARDVLEWLRGLQYDGYDAEDFFDAAVREFGNPDNIGLRS